LTQPELLETLPAEGPLSAHLAQQLALYNTAVTVRTTRFNIETLHFDVLYL